jgi:hypothetical protein
MSGLAFWRWRNNCTSCIWAIDGQWVLYAGYDYQGDLMLIDPFR